MSGTRKPTDAAGTHAAPDGFHDWILSLPWVVERPFNIGTPGVRTFAVDCEPLGIRQVWLVTGLPHGGGVGVPHGGGVGVIVPNPLAENYELVGVGRAIAQMPRDHTLMSVSDQADCADLDRAILDAYGTVLS
jgi:hypothetical protein